LDQENFPKPLVELRKRLANSTNKPLASPDFQSFTEFVQKIAQDIIKLRPQRHFEPVSVDYDLWFHKKGANDRRPRGHTGAHDVRFFWVQKMPQCFSNQILHL